MRCASCGRRIPDDETLCLSCEDDYDAFVVSCEGDDPDGVLDHHIEALDRAGYRAAR